MSWVKQFEQLFAAIPFNRMLGLTIDSIEKNAVTMSLTMRPELIGNFFHGILHGGVISSVLDMVGGAAAMIAFIEKNAGTPLAELQAPLSKASTINLHIDYLRPGKGNQFFAKSNVLRAGKKIIVTRMEFSNDEKLLIATGSGTYLIG